MASPDLRGTRNFIQRIQRLQQPKKRAYDGWITVPDDTWDVAFQNGWGNQGGDYPPLSFHLSDEGKVYIRGAVSGGVAGSVIFTLPDGFCPEFTELFIVAGVGGGYCQIQVDPTGDVTFVG